jgi:hypothetical protein
MSSNDAFGYAMAFTFGCFGLLVLVYVAWLVKEIFFKGAAR